MPRLPGVSQKDAVRVFQKLGYRVVRESGHLIMSNGERRLVIPRHDPINAITMGAIARDAGLTPQQFRDLHHRSFAVTAERRQLLWEEMDRCLELADRLSARLSAADQVD